MSNITISNNLSCSDSGIKLKRFKVKGFGITATNVLDLYCLHQYKNTAKEAA